MDDKQLCLLALDGGGARGLSLLLILQEIMARIDPKNPPKPCEYFDMIGGTGAGGLVAIMTGRLQMTVDECLKAYQGMVDKIFTKRRKRINLRNFHLQGQFDHRILEEAIKKLIVEKGYGEEDLLANPEGKCKVFVCTASGENRRIIRRLATYPSRGMGDLYSSTKIVQAARATSAVPSFFDSTEIGPYGEKFLGGIAGANNPIRQLWLAASEVWPEPDLESQLRCLISIGTGEPKLQPFGDTLKEIAHSLFEVATDTRRTAEEFQEEHTSLDDERRYFRFNVQRGFEDVALQDSSKKALIAAGTRTYLSNKTVQNHIDRCAELLGSKRVGAVLPADVKACLNSLAFDYEERRRQVTEPPENEKYARFWLRDNAYFQAWKDRRLFLEHHGVLWIAGHPGSGKSTLMKQLSNHLAHSNSKHDEVIIEFFFNAKSTDDLAHSATGLFRSLLHQLLLKTPLLPASIYDLFKRSKKYSSTSLHWSLEEVQEAFFSALERPGSKPVTILIDALDECGVETENSSKLEQIDYIYRSFQDFITKSVGSGRQINLCISCRHFPGLRFERRYKVTVENHNKEIIEAYVEKTLPSLQTISSTAMELRALKLAIIDKASGVFLWVQLIMNSLRLKILHGGRSIKGLIKSLDDVPKGLQALFSQLLSNFNTPAERTASIQLFYWLLFSRRPLNAGEVKDALLLSETASFDQPPHKIVDSWAAANQRIVDNRRFEAYILNISKGLVEIVKPRPAFQARKAEEPLMYTDSDEGTGHLDSFWKRRVQVIHSSIQNFFLDENGAGLDTPGLRLLQPSLAPSYIGNVHHKLLQDCLKYLSLAVIHKSIELRASPIMDETPTSESQAAVSDTESTSSLDSDDRFKKPALLLEYSAFQILEHAQKADENGIKQDKLARQLRRFSDGSILRMLLAINHQQPVQYVGGDLEADHINTIILALASFYNIPSCIKCLLDLPDVDKDGLIHCSDKYERAVQRTPLMIACQAGQEGAVKALLRAKVNVNIQNTPDGRTALHYAVGGSQKSIVKRLLKYGAKLQILDNHSLSPLHSATLNPQGNIVTYLLQKSPIIQTCEEQNQLLRFMFRRVVLGDHTAHDILAKQLEHIPDINYQDSQGNTPLGLAIRTGNFKLVERILEHGGDLWMGTDVFNNPLYNAVQRSSLAWVARIVTHNKWGVKYDLNRKDAAHGKTILHWAAEVGAIDLVKDLLEANVDISICDTYGGTALHYAAENGRFYTAQALIDNGADVHITDSASRNYRTPLDCALSRGHSEVAELLTSRMAEVLSLYQNESTSLKSNTTGNWAGLLEAVSNGHEAGVKYLLETGVDIESKDEGGLTPLSWAALRGRESIVKLLLDQGADFETRDKMGRTPLSWAAEKGRETIVKMLLEKNANFESMDATRRTPLSLAAERGYATVVQMFLDKGARFEVQETVYNRTALLWATLNGHLPIVKMILDKGANTEARDNLHDRTALSWAAYQGYEDILRILLEKGANVEARDKVFGRTPLLWAVVAQHEAVVKILVDTDGVDLDSTDNIGRNALFYLVISGQDMMSLVLKSQKQLSSAKDHYSASLLSMAVRHRYTGLVVLLLKNRDRAISDLDSGDAFGRTPLWWAKKTGADEIRDALLWAAKQIGVQVNDDINPGGDEPWMLEVNSFYLCDVCTMSIGESESHHECRVCNGGGFCICSGCIQLGAVCLDESHELIKRR